MTNWARRIEEAIDRRDRSLVFRAAVQARTAIERSRRRWGERGVPFEMRSTGPAPEREWVWLGEAIVETCTGRGDLATDTELLTFRIREETPIEAATRLDQLQVALAAEGREPPLRWLTPSGEPYLAEPAERLLSHAFRGWERELPARLREAADEKAEAELARRGAWPRAVSDAALRTLNEGRLRVYRSLIEAAYAPADELEARSAELAPGDRLTVYEAVAAQRGGMIPANDLTAYLDDRATRDRALELLRRLRGPSSPTDRATG